MNDEAYCFFTHLQSAVSFIDMMDATCLTINPDEFNRYFHKKTIFNRFLVTWEFLVQLALQTIN
jgi:hypothetical protein